MALIIKAWLSSKLHCGDFLGGVAILAKTLYLTWVDFTDCQMKCLKIRVAISLAMIVMLVGMPALAQNTNALSDAVLMPSKSDDSVLPQAVRDAMMMAGLSDDEVSFWVEPLYPLDDVQSNSGESAHEMQSFKNRTKRNAPIIHHQANRLRTPASIQKLIPTYIALNTLGADFHWATHIQPKGLVINGTLYGDLLIKGNGDPAMTYERLRAMLKQVQHQGIRHIHGNIVIDNSAFNNVKFDTNAFDGQGMRAYNAAPNAFLVNFGTVEVDVLPSGHDVITHEPAQATRFVPTDMEYAAVQILPSLADFHAPNQIIANRQSCLKETQLYLTKDKLAILGGTNATCGRRSYWLTFDDADILAVKAVKGEWQRLDDDFAGQVVVMDVSSYADMNLPWLTYLSKPLSEQIHLINQYSNNVMTEQVALSLPLLLTDAKSTDYPQAFDVITQWWRRHLTSQPPIMSRASGLCRDCAITPASMAELLAFAYHHQDFEVFKTSLPLAGASGTMTALRKRNPSHPAIGRAYVKTGTLNDVKSLAGYVMGRDGRWYVLVAMINAPNAGHDDKATAVLDEMLAYVAML
ncbi:D-alanyl-D-alanine carboxypeptidase/D-alanyl-D-alanine-endopeptidase [Moraxella sp. Tifton1]|uniref:D-alanyl-D-alanine carboxypeptidase/D-alanyl-D-alanine endopeptidase n=1 Tax=Moraxella oculi TaxID=2940516 RepID=UPI002013AA06|nr:D-alanyl-D-alanine carboxypeptidase/D-alanyl-D-alanine-endopeptidase [Moraxella sp. Tifton1]MCL1623962.1 D-alanyl-D-alanine carboxypeptidase/D-alanyl-D-alanine-endopeptidase [Moraxella sp. Tifton1]